MSKIFTKIKILTLDEKTPNSGRIYPKEEFSRALEEWLKSPNTKAGCFIEDLNYAGNLGEIPIDRISHTIKSISIEDNNVYADIEVLDTPAGVILEALLGAGDDSVRFAPVGTGLIEDFHNKIGSTVKEYQLITLGYHYEPVKEK